MSVGMAGVIAAHGGHSVKLSPQGAFTVQCHGCGRSTPVGEGKVPRSGAPIHAAHVAEELAKAGHGLVQEAQQDHVRAHTITVTETTAAGFDFQGCSAVNPHACACLTWVEVACPLCDEPICDGELIQTVTYPTIHSVDYDSMDQEWETDTWHASCADPLAVALADPEGHALVKAIHDRKAEG